MIVNGHPTVRGKPKPPPSVLSREPAPPPVAAGTPPPPGTQADPRQGAGPDGVRAWVLRSRQRLLLTDTTLRDAHQSLLATRLRTYDMLAGRPGDRAPVRATCSRWRCGAARRSTSPTASCTEDPWERLDELRQQVPNMLFQMLLRGANAVGYTNYPDNVVRGVHRGGGGRRASTCSASSTRSTTSTTCRSRSRRRRRPARIVEAAICYTGDISDPRRDEVRPQVLRRPGQGDRPAAARTCWRSRTWRACSSRAPRRCWSRR